MRTMVALIEAKTKPASDRGKPRKNAIEAASVARSSCGRANLARCVWILVSPGATSKERIMHRSAIVLLPVCRQLGGELCRRTGGTGQVFRPDLDCQPRPSPPFRRVVPHLQQ